ALRFLANGTCGKIGIRSSRPDAWSWTIRRRRPYGDDAWMQRTARQMSPEASLRPGGSAAEEGCAAGAARSLGARVNAGGQTRRVSPLGATRTLSPFCAADLPTRFTRKNRQPLLAV